MSLQSDDRGIITACLSIPTLAVFARGREAARTAGAMGADQIEAFVHRATS